MRFPSEPCLAPCCTKGMASPAKVWQSGAPDPSYEAKFSLSPLVLGTVKAALYAMLFTIPLAVGAAVFVGFFMPSRIRDRIKPAIELLEAFPTVVLGAIAAVWLAPMLIDILAPLLGVLVAVPAGIVVTAMVWRANSVVVQSRQAIGWLPIILAPLLLLFAVAGGLLGHWLELLLAEGDLSRWLELNWGVHVAHRNALLVGLAMGIALIPSVFSLAEDAIHSVPRGAAAGSLALGASHWQSYRDVVLPVAFPGIVSAITLGFGRAMGETMIVLMVAGNTPIVDWGILEGLRSISATLAIELPEVQPNSRHFRVLFLAALLLFALTFVFNTLAELLRMRARSNVRGMQ